MIEFAGKGIVLDLEGTTSSLRYVQEVLLPYAASRLESHLENKWDSIELTKVADRIAMDAGAATFDAWAGSTDPVAARAKLAEHIKSLMNGPVKTAGLRQLQGLIWREGYHTGQLKSHVYEDVSTSLVAWTIANIDTRIFASAPVSTQKLFFRYTIRGNLASYLKGYYDTTTGEKTSPDSYSAIAADMKAPADQILFISDMLSELDAAKAAGMKTAVAVRPESPPMHDPGEHPTLSSLSEITLQTPQ